MIINVLLIPQYQAVGAAIGTIAAEFSVMFVQVVAVRKKLPIKHYFTSVIPVMIIGFIMAVIVRIFGNLMGVSIMTLIVQICLGGIVYLSLLAMYLYLTKDEMWEYLTKMIFDLLRRFKSRTV